MMKMRIIKCSALTFFKVVVFFIFILNLYSCHIVQRRNGRVKLINNNKIVKGDSVFMIPVSFTWHVYLYGSPYFKPAAEDLAIERTWDSVQTEILRNYFEVSRLEIKIQDSLFKERKRSDLLSSGYPNMVSNLSSYNYMQFMLGIKNNQQDVAFTFLEDTILKLSEKAPIVIFTNDFFAFSASFQAGYAQGNTGAIFHPTAHIAIIKNREVVYFRNYNRRYNYDRFERKNLKVKVTKKLFDKLE